LRYFKVRQIGLFGSYARGEEGAASDIDLLVEYEDGGKSYANFIGLIDFLEDAFGQDVELVTRKSMSKYILPHVEKEVLYVQINA